MSPIAVVVNPQVVSNEETLHYAVTGLASELAGKSLQITVVGADSVVESMWLGTIGAVIAADGTAAAEYAPSLVNETVAWVSRLEVPDASSPRIWDNPALFAHTRCVINGDAPAGSAVDIGEVAMSLEGRRKQRYEAPLGDASDQSANEYAVLSIVERLKMTTHLRIPGGEILATSAANEASDEAHLVNSLLSQLGVGSTVPAEWWKQQSQNARPWTVIRFPSVWAADAREAAELAWDRRDRLLHILALNRGSSATAIVTLVEEVATGKGGAFYESTPYGGNLLGGFISGEDPHWLLIQEAAVQADPVLALATRLYREATAEASVDARYFRYWGLLETLSLNRIGEGHPVSRIDGTPWPGKHGTTSFATPRVYELLKRHTRATPIAEASVASPAASLEEAVRGWYARRNATAHYGVFDPNDPLQQAQGWFSRALAIHNAAQLNSGVDNWLRALRDATVSVLHEELGKVGRPLVV